MDYLQEMVQDVYDDFSGDVKSARPQVEEDSMRGQVFMGKKAKANGLVDLNGSLGDALTILLAETSRG